MEIKVLGPLAISEQNATIVPSATKPRQLLALLALRCNRTVSTATLIDEIWGEEVPKSASATLHTYVMQIRRKISAAVGGPRGSAREILQTSYSGYAILGQADNSDIAEFRHLSTRGTFALESGDPRSASRLLRQALDLWRGSALEGVRLGPVLRIDAMSLEEERLGTLRQRITADFQLGRHSALIAELRVQVMQLPMDENFSTQLMEALYRSGSAWRALEEYQRLRRCLVGELGVEPSARAQSLQRTILAGDSLDDLRTVEWSGSNRLLS